MKYIAKKTIKKDEFNIWAFSDVHDGAVSDELSLACTQIDSEKWDIGLVMGDQVAPDDDTITGFTNYINQFNPLNYHSLNNFYHLGGNHDRTPESNPDGRDFYFRKYCSPIPGDNDLYNDQPYTPEGIYNAFSVEIGNVLILMLGDDNGGGQPGGESGLSGGSINFRASGNISSQQWDWFKNKVENNREKIIIVGSHQGIKDTTIGTGWKEFNQAFTRNENYLPLDHYEAEDSKRAGYISYINNCEGKINTETGDSEATNQIKSWLKQNGKYIDLWMHGHYHRKLGDVWNGRTRFEVVYDIPFIDVSSMNSKLHLYYWGKLEVKSNLINIKGKVMTIKTYVHKDPNGLVNQGFYLPEELRIPIKTEFKP